MAGLAIGRSGHAERVAFDLNSVAAVFVPVFFVLIGVNTDLGAMLRPEVLLVACSLFAVADRRQAGGGAGRIGPRAPIACSSASACCRAAKSG